jgi:transcriptional regulator
MYIPQHFDVTDKEKALAFIKAKAFGQLISMVNGRLFSSHIPFLVDDDGNSIHCHIAKNNPQWESIEEQEVLATFQGPHGYVSPSWYNSPGVPTWNYQVVHVYGRPELVTNTEKLKHSVDELIKTNESSMPNPWNAEHKESSFNGIIGIKIKITEIQCKYKLSQNRSESDRKQVIEELQNMGSVQLATAMKKEL